MIAGERCSRLLSLPPHTCGRCSAPAVISWQGPEHDGPYTCPCAKPSNLCIAARAAPVCGCPGPAAAAARWHTSRRHPAPGKPAYLRHSNKQRLAGDELIAAMIMHAGGIWMQISHCVQSAVASCDSHWSSRFAKNASFSTTLPSARVYRISKELLMSTCRPTCGDRRAELRGRGKGVPCNDLPQSGGSH
jgi:hypothetical protein